MYTAAQVYEMAAALLNDQAGTIYTQEVQQPYLNIALRDLATLLQRANIPISNYATAAIEVIAGATEIDANDMPEGLVEIQGLYQREAGSSDDYFQVTRTEFLPEWDESTERTAFIPAWSWMGEVVRFIPANQALELKLNYIKNTLPTIGSPDDPISMINSLNFLGFRTAALCAMYIGENPTRAASLDMQASVEWDKIEGISTKGRQSIATRRRPFRYKTYGGNVAGW